MGTGPNLSNTPSRINKGITTSFQPSSSKTDFFICILLIIGLGIIAYHNSFAGVFLLDDNIRIVNNDNIHSLAWPWPFLKDVRRPVLYFTLAVNYALGALDPFGYHVFNLAIHITSALFLFGIIRQTCSILKFPSLRDSAQGAALMTSLLWLTHPLQTQSVTYIIQRAESLMGMFYLFSFYSAVRFLINKERIWIIYASIACLLAGLTKEVAVTIPVVILLYDRAFISASFQEAFIRHKRLYAGLIVTWVIMFYLLATVKPVEVIPSAGLKLQVSPIIYLLNQPVVILHYLKLAVWPHPLVFDYAWQPVQRVTETFPAVIIILALIGLSVWAYRRRPGIGFLGLSFFLVLSPSSSIIPLKDFAFEHRMYLPLACVIVLIVFVVQGLFQKIAAPPLLRRKAGMVLAGLVIAFFCILTAQRNRSYHSGLAMWGDTLNKRPRNARASNDYANFLFRGGYVAEAMPYFMKSLALNPDARAHTDFGAYLLNTGQVDQAVEFLNRALTYDADYTDAHVNLGIALSNLGKFDEAAQHYIRALELEPDYGVVYNNLGAIFSNQENYQEAISYFEKALEFGFKEAGVYHNLGIAFAKTGRPQEAVAHIRESLRLDPNSQEAREHLNEILRNMERER